MYRIRFHGRGGQGMKTASRILGSAFFREGFEVQDAPRYGAERRGAPIFAYVRAARAPIHERGPIPLPDLVVVADDSLVGVPAAGVLQGLDAHSVLLIDSAEPPGVWRRRLNTAARVLVLPRPAAGHEAELRYVGAACAGAAAALVGKIRRDALAAAVEDEIAPMGAALTGKNRDAALAAFDHMASDAGAVTERAEASAAYAPPDWVDLQLEDADVSAPSIPATLTSVEVRTGLWRTLRPVIDYERCRRCWWVCSTFCPDDAITVSKDGTPRIDYDHCKGCLICVAQCPPHAIGSIPESEAAADSVGDPA